MIQSVEVNDANRERIPIFDLRRASAYGFALENVRFAIQQSLELHKYSGLNSKISRRKSLELFLELCYKDPRPILEYKISGVLPRVELMGSGKSMHFEWTDEPFRDCIQDNEYQQL